MVVCSSKEFHPPNSGPLYDPDQKSFVILETRLIVKTKLMTAFRINKVDCIRGQYSFLWDNYFLVTECCGVTNSPDSFLSLNMNYQVNRIPPLHVARVVGVTEIDGALLIVWLAQG